MDVWLLGLGLLGLVGCLVWYVVILRDSSPGRHVALLTRGDIPVRSIYLWLLVVLLSQSVVFAALSHGFNVVAGVVAAFVLSEVGRWWHNRSVGEELPAEPGARPDGTPED